MAGTEENENNHVQSGSISEPENRDGEEVAKITQFQELTGIDDLEECRRKLETHSWDLERAVHDTFNEREGVSGVYDQPPPPPEPEVRQRRIPATVPLVNNNRSQQRIFNTHHRPAATEEWGVATWGMQLFYLPFRFIYSSIFDLVRFFLGLFRPDPSRRLTDPVADVENFIREYNNTYGTEHPNFYHGTYSQALNEAKQELKFLIVYLHGDEHQDTERFCRHTLSSTNVVQYINEQSIFWACNINSGEGYRVSQALKEHTYPFLAVIVLKENRMTVVARIEGCMSDGELLGALHGVKEDNEMHLIAARVERDERLVNRSLREEQDAAYQESALRDREKARQRQDAEDKILEEERQRQQEEDDKLREIELKERLKQQWKEEIPEEPESSHPECVKILIKLPSSVRIERRFLLSHSLKYLYYLVFCHGEAPDNFDIITSYPRKTLPCKPSDDFEPPTFQEHGIVRSETFFVHDHDA